MLVWARLDKLTIKQREHCKQHSAKQKPRTFLVQEGYVPVVVMRKIVAGCEAAQK